MIEVRGDMWEYDAPIKCITTNGFVRADGRAVMGRGVALQATQRYPTIAAKLGTLITMHGNHLNLLGYYDSIELWAFPVKHHWHDKASLDLIIRSAKELAVEMDDPNVKGPIVLPKPGCGNGQLRWRMVKPAIESILDDRFHIIDL